MISESCSKGRSGLSFGLTLGALACVAGMLCATLAYAVDPRIDVYVASGRGGTVAAEPERLTLLARERGPVPLIVRFRTDFVPEGDLSEFQAANQRTAINSVQGRVLSRLADARNVWRYKSVPMIAITIGAGDIETLLDDPNVDAIYQDVPARPLLFESVPLIRANKLWNKRGVRGGKGWAVAVLDTGVQLNHPALKGKVVSGACYSTSRDFYGSKSLCPGRAASATTKRSATYCPMSIDGCEHGTHVSVIAVGNPPNEVKGVARNANLIPIQVFSEYPPEVCDDPDPCLSSLDSDQIKGLERVNELSKKFKIASVNMSIGGEPQKACPNDPLAPIIRTLTSKKIAVVVAAGNEFEGGKVVDPACIPEAISVGSTTIDDEVSDFSNFANKLVDLMAPGSDIVSSVPVNGYEMLSGTSMAAPHVAGAWALLRAADPDASVAKIRRVLRRTGVTVGRDGITNKRIDVWAAYKKLKKRRGGK